MKKIEFAFPPTPTPAFSADARYVTNIQEGPDIDALRQFILAKMPEVEKPEVVTTYHILFTQRNEEAPSSFPKLSAIVDARCTGPCWPDEWYSVEGLYLVSLAAFQDATSIIGYRLLIPINDPIARDIYAPLPSIEQIYAVQHAAVPA